MESSKLSQIAEQGTRIFVGIDMNVLWVTNMPTEQNIVIFDHKTHKATQYVRMRPNRDSEWWDWKIIGEIDME